MEAMGFHVRHYLSLCPGYLPQTEVFNVAPEVVTQSTAPQHEHFTLLGQWAEYATYLPRRHCHLGTIHIELHQPPIIGSS